MPVGVLTALEIVVIDIMVDGESSQASVFGKVGELLMGVLLRPLEFLVWFSIQLPCWFWRSRQLASM